MLDTLLLTKHFSTWIFKTASKLGSLSIERGGMFSRLIMPRLAWAHSSWPIQMPSEKLQVHHQKCEVKVFSLDSNLKVAHMIGTMSTNHVCSNAESFFPNPDHMRPSNQSPMRMPCQDIKANESEM
jgi:hypothetical protein